MARRFHFPLETLLKVRRLYEREAKRKVAAQHAKIARLDQADEATRREIQKQQGELLGNQQQKQLSAPDLAGGWAWIAHLRNTMTRRQHLRDELDKELEQIQATFREARKQTRIIEKLRERKWSVYRHERQRQEQATADELAQQLHGFANSPTTPSATMAAE
ncbi:MAG: flagellar export protein FliJ [Planctomycetota bacterium]